MGSPVATDDLVMLDITDPALDPHGPEIRAARAAHWCARTPMGLAVLRHDKLTMLLGDRRLVQGSHRILTAQGLTTGPLVEWMNTMILSMEGDDHLRVRRLVSRAFTPTGGDGAAATNARNRAPARRRFPGRGRWHRRVHGGVRRPLPGPGDL